MNYQFRVELINTKGKGVGLNRQDQRAKFLN